MIQLLWNYCGAGNHQHSRVYEWHAYKLHSNVWENEVNQQSLEIGHRIFVKVGTYDPPVSTAKMTLMTFPPDKILFATRIDPYHMARE